MRQLTASVRSGVIRMESVLRYSAGTLGTNVSVRTPVDTGELRASWTPAVNALDGSNAGGNIFAVANTLELGDTFSLVNGRHYARRIEYEGWSNQAPSGMLRISVAEWPAIVAQAVRRAG